MADDNKHWHIGGIAFVGCFFVGMALGYLFHNTSVGALLGLGVGFLVMAVLRWQHKE